MKEKLRKIPSVHELQQNQLFQQAAEQIGEEKVVTSWLRNEVDLLRQAFLENIGPDVHTTEEIKTYLLERLKYKSEYFQEDRLQRVINATGTILHTNLGRANMSEAAVKKVAMAARSYTNLEYEITSGQRGSRHSILEDLIKECTGAEAAMVVNNNAAAVYLVLKGLTEGKEVIVSRGQLVEIGGSFRVSSIMEESGASLVEVGTTNKTHPHDYKEAVNEQTAMIMKVHTSNFKTIGFTAEVPLKELVNIAKENEDLIVYEDLGSGALYDFKNHGIGGEPTVSEALNDGADLVTFSGDKLLGGPQAGIIAGKKKWINHLKKHQLARVLRVDKMTLAALEETLKAYLQGEEGVYTIPTAERVLETKQSIKQRAEAFTDLIHLSEWQTFIEEDVSKVGGGTMPEVTLPTAVVHLHSGNTPAQVVIDKLRTETKPAVVARIKEEKVVFDFRTITEEESKIIAGALQTIEKEMQSLS
ncbi:L-seryl-tRNA(Sec) selenium transferase [Alteribacillus bidgolensis]|uniref:L-seryl-tRNA(Sec) selenium transferase n=1 Tax=Alteribacillus bidgolensis TaxID=930129 RepID=A0A1G8D4P2_9BACI|nr:L-seryl-tRNA(Sec) selenium transferase [Alteribacillus bidgolensis]SDH52662.1 L-seryl-tRNA(Sec) selenium transferase [Alteribacillus bidgolensis]